MVGWRSTDVHGLRAGRRQWCTLHNPAVTTAVVLSGRGKCPLDRGLCYCAVQLGAAQMAGVILGQIASGPGEVFSLGPQGHFLWPAVFAAELAFTFLLAFVVLAVATTRLPHSPSKQHFHFGLSIGGCVTAGGFAVGAVSGGVLNPAVAWSLATAIDSSKGWESCLTLALFELAGGVLAAAVFGATHSWEFKKPGSLLD
ncbi:unnamed protein product [Polarella glacialis]|uniref:Aquaporin n=1 Tax=Polarella glacialis TaxID=89957 RepID=A0A813DKZ4_POLGL|nr:unnamed protein product [Polarella glacialis]